MVARSSSPRVLRTPSGVPAPSSASDDAAHPYAALDLGSNSFHLIVAYDQGGRLQVVDRHKETVRLAEGLAADNRLDAAVGARALACLTRFGQRLRHLPSHHVRVVGTNTLRRVRNSHDFIDAAECALGHPVEIVSGREEARLIYLGVSHFQEDNFDSRLVVDIGGGSTELILGRQFQPRLMESLYMGCVSMSAAFFADARITAARFADAENAARQELEVVEEIYRARGWDTAIGASGTLLAVHDAILELTGVRSITPAGVLALKRRLIAAGSVAAAGLEAVDAERVPVFAGGLAIVSAVFDALGVAQMTVSDAALREGVLHDLLGRVHAQDIRETTVTDLMDRYRVDDRHAWRVAATATRMLEQVAWDFAGADAQRLLRWGAMLHEIGMDIAHSQYHKHGAYLLDNMDLPGFSRPEQHSLSLIVRAHRRKFPVEDLAELPELTVPCVLLRLAAVLHRARADDPLPAFSVALGDDRLELTLPRKWLDNHPLTRLDLSQESEYLSVIPMTLSVSAP